MTSSTSKRKDGVPEQTYINRLEMQRTVGSTVGKELLLRKKRLSPQFAQLEPSTSTSGRSTSGGMRIEELPPYTRSIPRRVLTEQAPTATPDTLPTDSVPHWTAAYGPDFRNVLAEMRADLARRGLAPPVPDPSETRANYDEEMERRRVLREEYLADRDNYDLSA